MSGPKVVRIVTREEILEICYGHLARVDAALAEWQRIGKRNDCVDEGAIAAALQRREALAALIAADRLMDIQKQAPVEEAFLRADIQTRLSKVFAKQAEARSRERREQQAAAGLLKRLRSLDVPLDPGVEAGLARGDSQAMAQGFALLADAVAGASASTSNALAGKLRDGDPSPKHFADWLAGQPVAPTDSAIERIAARLDELGMLVDAEVLLPWRARLAEAETAPMARRNLLVDGLEVETGRALTEARRRAVLAEDLHLVLAEQAAAGGEGAVASAELASLDVAALETRIEAVRASLEDQRKARAVAARRAAVLEGLQALGYAVNEGMSTSAAEGGRLVLRSSSRPDYGVEIAAAGATGSMQMRPVAFDAGGQGPDPARDRDAETIWCGDVSVLQDYLAKVGDALAIERSLPVGATPLKRIAVAGPDGSGGATAPVLKERSFR
ncbi:hypothetical protein G4G27_07210 [Sphingomonas sp. So64.6b]|uniref:hypothetical protein n=1 Tax=Sphingomonas sp. So64.6b TaxID=2997354 RepID=UPI001603B36F|nr:hypothetical protein [Sphingomonas sp. So64.6b]QNA83796.1 hypothetical protein G4G27_07210 [Sphingomonas sp. So64.6b]